MKGKQLYERERDSYLEVIEDHREINRGKEYNCKTIKSGDQLEVQLYETWNSQPTGRNKKLRVSREQQKKLNLRNSQMRAVRLLNTNFKAGDTWLTLTYNRLWLPATIEDANRMIKNYIRTVRRRFGKDVKYIYVTEFGSGRVHHHLIVNVSDRDTLEELWSPASERRRKRKNPACIIKQYGRTQARKVQPDTDFNLTGMAMYITKESIKNMKKFVCSKNLEKPVEKKTKNLKGRKITKKNNKKRY